MSSSNKGNLHNLEEENQQLCQETEELDTIIIVMQQESESLISEVRTMDGNIEMINMSMKLNAEDSTLHIKEFEQDLYRSQSKASTINSEDHLFIEKVQKLE